MNKERVNNVEEEDVIDLLELFHALWSKAWLIIICAVIGAVLAFGVSEFLISPKYTATTKMYVNNKNSSSTSSYMTTTEISAAKSLVDTYVVILKMRPTLEKVIQNTGVPYTTAELAKMLSANHVDNTEIFAINVTSKNAVEASIIANEIANVLPEAIAAVVDGSAVRVVENAVTPTKPSSPNIMRNTAIGGLAFAFVVCGIIVLRFLLDTVIHDEEYLTKNLNVPVLAVIPDLKFSQAQAD